MKTAAQQSFLDRIDAADRILIVFPKNPSLDILCASLLLQKLTTTRQKDAHLTTPSLEPIESHLAKLPSIATPANSVGSENLVVSFEYSPEQVDKVSYHIGEHTQRFYLTLKPKKGFQPLDTNTVELEYVGSSADLVITVGVRSLDSLEQLYFGYEEQFEKTQVIAISSFTSPFAGQTLTPDGNGYTQLMIEMFSAGQASLDSDSATVALAGLSSATAQFSDVTTTAAAFDSAAALLRAGARRLKLGQENTKSVGRESATTETSQTVPQKTPQEVPQKKTAAKVIANKAGATPKQVRSLGKK